MEKQNSVLQTKTPFSTVNYLGAKFSENVDISKSKFKLVFKLFNFVY